MTCPIANQIAIHCNEPERQSASEILNALLATNVAYIDGELYDLAEVTSSIDDFDMSEAFQSALEGDDEAITQAYLKAILELMK